MKIMDLVRGDRRSLEYRESSVREDGSVRLARSPILTRHVAVVGGRSAPGEAIAFIIRAHAVEAITARQLSLKVIDASRARWNRRPDTPPRQNKNARHIP